MSEQPERSPSGQPIYRHGEKAACRPPSEHAAHLKVIEAHVEKHIGKIETVYHEMLSDQVHLYVLLVPATAERPFHALVTSGASDLPMAVPEGMEAFNRVELMIALPPTWPLTQESMADETIYWPIRWLKMVARLPHEYRTWIGWGHTVPNGDPAEAIANTGFVGVMLSPAYGLSPEFFQLPIEGGDNITFYQMVPLYPEEMALKLRKGAEEIEKRLERSQCGMVLNPERPNVGKSRRWFPWLR